MTGMEEGRQLFVRMPDSRFTFANFARTQLYSAMAALKIGMDILIDEEHVEVDTLLGHGGFFKAKGVGQQLMAGALRTPVSVMETAGEGGPWGMALLASYLVNCEENETLEDYLDTKIFAGAKGVCAEPQEADMAGFAAFLDRYKAALPAERAAVDTLK
jgi:sugar (pentulose or hexulose) kinase